MVKRALNPARKAYVHVVCGELAVNGKRLAVGATALAGESLLRLDSGRKVEVLVFDMAE